MSRKITLVEYFERFINRKKVSCEMTTIHGYFVIFKNIKNHPISQKCITEISNDDIQEYLYSQRSHLKDTTIKKHYVLLKSMFKNLLDEELIQKDIFKSVSVPKENKYIVDVKNVYSKNEIINLLNMVEGTFLELPVNLSLYLGLRRGEIVGLKWGNVFFEDRYVYICNTITRAGNVICEKTVKTRSSFRKIAFDEHICRLLKKEKVRQEEISKKTKAKFEYVMSSDDGEHINPDKISKMFYNFIFNSNLRKIRFHDLRHTFASIANHMGMTLFDISKTLGHSDTSVTSKVYVHLFEETHKKHITVISDFLQT